MANQAFSDLAIFDYILTRRDGEKLIDTLEYLIARGENKVRADTLPSELAVLSDLISKSANLEIFLEEFVSAFWRLKFINLKLAYEPRRTFLFELKRNLSKNMNEPLIFDLEVDPAIVGGAVIVVNNHYRDYSVASRYAFLLSPRRHKA